MQFSGVLGEKCPFSLTRDPGFPMPRSPQNVSNDARFTGDILETLGNHSPRPRQIAAILDPCLWKTFVKFWRWFNGTDPEPTVTNVVSWGKRPLLNKFLVSECAFVSTGIFLSQIEMGMRFRFSLFSRLAVLFHQRPRFRQIRSASALAFCIQSVVQIHSLLPHVSQAHVDKNSFSAEAINPCLYFTSIQNKAATLICEKHKWKSVSGFRDSVTLLSPCRASHTFFPRN